MARVCLLSPGHLSTNPRLVKEALALKEAGHDVHIIHGSFTAWGAQNDAPIAKVIGSTRAVRFGPVKAPRAIYLRQTAVRRANYALASLGVVPLAVAENAHSPVTPDLCSEAADHPSDLYIAHYVAALPAAAKAARRHGTLYAFDAEDFHPGDLPDTPEHRLDKAIVHRIESQYLPGAAYVSAASPMIGEAYVERYGICPTTTILNVFPRENAPAAFTERGAIEPSPSVYWFSQTVGPGRGLETAIEAIAKAASRPHLYLRGTPARGYEALLRGKAQAAGVAQRLHLLPPAPPDQLERLGAAFDLGLVSELGETHNRGIALTNKLFSYLLGGVPSLASDIPSHQRIAPHLGAAMTLFQTGEAGALAEAIDALLLHPNRLAKARAHAWELGQSRYNWRVESNILLGLVEETLRNAAVTKSIPALGPT